MTLFWFWLTSTQTQVTVLAPFAFVLLGLSLVPAWRSKGLRLVLMAIALTPASLALSFWNSKGFHIVPMITPVLAWMAIRELSKPGSSWTLNVRRHWGAVASAIWAGQFTTDTLGAYLAWHYQIGTSGYCIAKGTPAWFWGVGGDGWSDGLFTAPAIFTLALLFCQEALRRRWFAFGTKAAPVAASTF